MGKTRASANAAVTIPKSSERIDAVIAAAINIAIRGSFFVDHKTPHLLGLDDVRCKPKTVPFLHKHQMSCIFCRDNVVPPVS